ncbi:MAG: protein kinase [Planctomycetaceae bacterium]|nr:protein kinase [Planctomycetaceae bacterium]
MSDTQASPAPDLDEVLGRCLEHLERGDSAALCELVAAHPQFAEDLTRRLALLADAGLLPEVEAAEHPPERIGPFTLRGRLGAGAMGVVWRAWQEPPGREVALKVVRPEQLLFPSSRARFRREVELAARLSHPSILPILAVGEDDGLPWFATELVEGTSLAELVQEARRRAQRAGDVDLAALQQWLAERAGRDGTQWRGSDGAIERTWSRFALRIARDLARALAHAHGRGVLHRDVKPQNALLGADGRVWLADFGLASAPEDVSLTGTRSTVGSLPYMAPELLAGAAPDVRADVYGLGALLHELLLLRRPFEESQAAALVASILAGERRTPRALDPALARDAEAVLERALARDPAQRYPGADAFADDLDRLLSGRPTAARPRAAWARLWIAAERSPARAAAALLALVLVVGGPLGFGVQARGAAEAVKRERDRTVAAERERARAAEGAAREIAAERDRAQNAYGRAMEAVDRMLSRLGGDLAHVPAMEDLRRRIFEDAIGLLERVALEAGSSLGGAERLELARARARVGDLESLLGRPARAADAYRDARELAAEVSLDPESTHVPEALDLEVRLAADEVRARALAGELAEASALGEAALARLASMETDLEPARLVEFVARLDSAVGVALTRRGVAEGLVRQERAARELDRLLRTGPDRALHLEQAFRAWHSYTVDSLRALGDRPPDESLIADLVRTGELAEARVVNGGDPSCERDLVSARINLAGAHLRRRELDEAQALYELARADAKRLAANHPSTLTFRLELANALNQLALIEELREHYPEASDAYAEVLQILEELCRLAPQDAGLLHRLALAQMNASGPLRVERDLIGARQLIEEALVTLAHALALSPDEAEYRSTLLTLHGARWILCADGGDHAGVAAAARALAELELAPPHDRMALHRAAYAFVVAFDVVRQNDTLGAEERESLLARYAEAACELTQRSYLAGNRYPDLTALKNLEPLHGRPEFDALLGWFETAREEQ